MVITLDIRVLWVTGSRGPPGANDWESQWYSITISKINWFESFPNIFKWTVLFLFSRAITRTKNIHVCGFWDIFLILTRRWITSSLSTLDYWICHWLHVLQVDLTLDSVSSVFISEVGTKTQHDSGLVWALTLLWYPSMSFIRIVIIL